MIHIKTIDQFYKLFDELDLNKEMGVYLYLNGLKGIKTRVICSMFSINEIIDINQAILNKKCYVEVLK